MDKDEAEQIKRRHTAELLKLKGVTGVGLKRGEKGEPVLLLYLDDTADPSRLPTSIDGLSLTYERAGRFEPF